MSAREYTHDERYKIIRYILDNKKFAGLKGHSIWKEIEKARIINRTWQSMRTQFKGKILDLLHLFDITEEDRRNILNASGKKVIERKSNYDNCYVRIPVTKRSRFSFSSDSDSDATFCTTDINKNNETSGKRVKCDVAPSSPDLLLKDIEIVPTSSNYDSYELGKNSKYHQLKKCGGSKRKKSDQNSDNSDQLDVVEIDDSDVEANIINCDAIPFSLEEDTEIINFFKKDERYLCHMYDESAYKIFLVLHSSKRSCEALKNRFINHILPNLFNYKCLSYDEMIKYYDKSDLEVPEELQCKIRELMADRINTVKNVTVRDSSTSTNQSVTHASTQVSELPSDSDKFNMFIIENFIGITLDESVHAFIPEFGTNKSASIQRIQDDCIIPEENIHVVDTKLFTMLNSVNKVRCEFQKELKLFINEYFQKNEFNILNMIPIMDKVKLLIKNISKSHSVENTDLSKTVGNLFQDLEENQKEQITVNESNTNCEVNRKESQDFKNKSSTNTSSTRDVSDSIVPSTPLSETCISSVEDILTIQNQISQQHNAKNVNKLAVWNDNSEKELTFDIFENKIARVHTSSQMNNFNESENNSEPVLLSVPDGVHEISTELTVETTLEFHHPRKIENQSTESSSSTTTQSQTNLMNPQISDFTPSDELPRNSISNETRITSEDIDSEKITEASHVSYAKLGTENEQNKSNKSSNESQTPTTSDTFYSACSQDIRTQN